MNKLPLPNRVARIEVKVLEILNELEDLFDEAIILDRTTYEEHNKRDTQKRKKANAVASRSSTKV